MRVAASQECRAQSTNGEQLLKQMPMHEKPGHGRDHHRKPQDARDEVTPRVRNVQAHVQRDEEIGQCVGPIEVLDLLA